MTKILTAVHFTALSHHLDSNLLRSQRSDAKCSTMVGVQLYRQFGRPAKLLVRMWVERQTKCKSSDNSLQRHNSLAFLFFSSSIVHPPISWLVGWLLLLSSYWQAHKLESAVLRAWSVSKKGLYGHMKLLSLSTKLINQTSVKTHLFFWFQQIWLSQPKDTMMSNFLHTNSNVTVVSRGCTSLSTEMEKETWD